MEASAHRRPAPSAFALGNVSGRELVLEGHGLNKLALMVGVVFERMTAVEEKQPGQRPAA